MKNVCLTIIAVSMLLLTVRAQACIIFFMEGGEVSITNEDVIILWDPATKTEHFIREARFESSTDDFGFVVPTPGKPDVEEADPAAFQRVRKFVSDSTSGGPRNKYSSFGIPDSVAPVEVLEEKRVAGMDIAVLRANDSDALVGWLTDHNYKPRESLVPWAYRYVEQDYVFTAFKYSRDNPNTTAVNARAVRMTFKTETPFYPYREPSDAAAPEHRQLKVFFFSPSPKTPKYREEGFARPAKGFYTIFEGEVSNARELLTGAVPANAVPEKLRLQVFEDITQTRPNSDIFFRDDQREDEAP